MRGEHLVTERLQALTSLLERGNRRAIAANRTRQVYFQDETRMKIRIRRLDPSVPEPSYQTAAAAGFDLAASEEVVVPAHQIRLVPTGLVIEVPKGHFLGVFARSSTPLKRGLMVANGVGVVDPDYAGPDDQVFIQVLNVTDGEVTVKRGDRIAQGIVLSAARVEFEEGTTRTVSRGGFGSTGG
jgi:dUTP pyrophosphatase